jgi:hypothetical protein
MKSVKKLESVKTQLFNNSELNIVKGRGSELSRGFCLAPSSRTFSIADNLIFK